MWEDLAHSVALGMCASIPSALDWTCHGVSYFKLLPPDFSAMRTGSFGRSSVLSHLSSLLSKDFYPSNRRETNAGRDTAEEEGAAGKAVWGCCAFTLPWNDPSSAAAVLKVRESHPFVLECQVLSRASLGHIQY